MRRLSLIFLSLFFSQMCMIEALAERDIVFSADNRIRRVLTDAKGGIWVLQSRSSIVHKYSMSGLILAGVDISSSDQVLLAPGERKTLHDIALDEDGRLFALVGVSHRPTKQIASFVFRFPDLKKPPEVVSLGERIAGYKFGIDGKGGFVILGLKSNDLLAAEYEHVSGDYLFVHRFTSEGSYSGSSFSMHIDASSEDTLTRELASPLHHEGNFAVAENGEAWILWLEFPAEDILPDGKIPSRLYRVDARGDTTLMHLTPPSGGSFIAGVFLRGTTGQVLIDWKGRGAAGLETIVSAPEGPILCQGDYNGWVVGVTNDRILLAGTGSVEGRFSLLSRTIE